MVMTSAKPETSGAVRPTLVDGDIHTTFASSAVLKKYLSPRWHEYHDQYAKWGYDGSNYPKDGLNGGSRGDSVPPEGGRPARACRSCASSCSTSGASTWRSTTRSGTARRIVIPSIWPPSAAPPTTGSWRSGPSPSLDQGLDHDPVRLRRAGGSEIDRLGPNPNYVQVLMSIRTAEPLGPPALLADLRGGRAARPADRDPLRRPQRPPDHRDGWPSYYYEYRGCPRASSRR